MLNLILQRLSLSKFGTYGVLMKMTEIGNVPIMLTLEEPWNDNEPNNSCIPAGSYDCKRVQSPKFGDTFEVCGIFNRNHILFHSGNTIDDTHGCVLLGMQLNYPNVGIADSKLAFKVFSEMLEGMNQCHIEIKNP